MRLVPAGSGASSAIAPVAELPRSATVSVPDVIAEQRTRTPTKPELSICQQPAPETLATSAPPGTAAA